MTRVFVSVGSNVERDFNIQSSIHQLEKLFGPLTLSGVYQSPPMGFDGEDFYNLAAGFDTNLDFAAVRTSLRGIEDAHGRRRIDKKLGPRPLDIDLLLFGDKVQHFAGIDLPRGEIFRYAFVLLPLWEIAADLTHPETGRTIDEIWREFEKQDQPIAKVDFDFSTT